jgi:hypothetical protein
MLPRVSFLAAVGGFAAFAVATIQVHASDRATLTGDILSRVQSVENGIERLRVYPSRRLVIQRSASLGSETTVDGSVDTLFEGKIRKDILSRNTPGKILAVEEVESVDGAVVPEKTDRLIVSFDSSCTTRSCAFIFENPPLGERSRWGSLLTLSRRGTSFFLAAYPADAEVTRVDALWVGRKPFFWRKMERFARHGDWLNVYENKGWNPFVLEVKLHELTDIEHETVKYDGWRD